MLAARLAAESEISVLADRHDRVKLCHRVVKDLAMREPDQLKEDIEMAISTSQEAVDAKAEENATNDTLGAVNATDVLNKSAAITSWTRRKMTNCLFNAKESDVEDFKRPGGAFLTGDRVRTLSTYNASFPELLTDAGFEDLEAVLLGKDGSSTVGEGWSGLSMGFYFTAVIGVLAYGSLTVVQKVTMGKNTERRKTPKELRNEEKKERKKA